MTLPTMTDVIQAETDEPSVTGHLVLHQLRKTFGEGTSSCIAVDDIDLEIQPGEFVTILGPSGCGKTTTLRMIAGFETPDRGRIVLDGDDLVVRAPNRRPMAMVFQSYALFPHMSVFDNVAYGLRLKRPRVRDLEAQVHMALTSMNIAGLADRSPNQLSGGQQQRVALARALVMRPKVLLFDEPLSNLDAKLRVHMRGEIRRLQRRLGITSVFVTHDQDEAMTLSDRIVVMNDGHIEQFDTPQEIYRRPASVFVADFIGRANFLDAVVESVSDDVARVIVLGMTVDVPAHKSVQLDQPAVLVVRPEAIWLGAAPDAETDDDEDRRGIVLSAMFHGESIEYELETVAGNVVVVVPKPLESDVYPVGATVLISLEHARTWLLPQPT